MRPILAVLLAGAMMASVSSASIGENWSEARFQAKMGRPTPMAERERRQLAQARRIADNRCMNCCSRATHGSKVEGVKPGAAATAQTGWLAKSGRAAAPEAGTETASACCD